MSEKRKRRFRVYHFNAKTKLLEFTETATTKAIDDEALEKILKDRVSKYSCCYQVLK